MVSAMDDTDTESNCNSDAERQSTRNDVIRPRGVLSPSTRMGTPPTSSMETSHPDSGATTTDTTDAESQGSQDDAKSPNDDTLAFSPLPPHGSLTFPPFHFIDCQIKAERVEWTSDEESPSRPPKKRARKCLSPRTRKRARERTPSPYPKRRLIDRQATAYRVPWSSDDEDEQPAKLSQDTKSPPKVSHPQKTERKKEKQ